MPSIMIKNIKFYFYSNDHTPVHVHVRIADAEAKIDVENLIVVKSKGFNQKQLTRLLKLVTKNKEMITEVWNEHFKKE